jgi:hypothetical protein
MRLSYRESPLPFFLFVFVLSFPFLVVGALSNVNLLPGIPLAGLAIVCPVTAALILVYRKTKLAGVMELLKRSVDFRRVKSKLWYVPLVLIMPCIMLLSYTVMNLMGAHLPSLEFSVVRTLALFIAFFIGALSDELGGRDMPSTLCKIALARSEGPPFSGRCGPFGIGSHFSRFLDRSRLSRGGHSARCRFASLSLGSIIIQAAASLSRPCFMR